MNWLVSMSSCWVFEHDHGRIKATFRLGIGTLEKAGCNKKYLKKHIGIKENWREVLKTKLVDSKRVMEVTTAYGQYLASQMADFIGQNPTYPNTDHPNPNLSETQLPQYKFQNPNLPHRTYSKPNHSKLFLTETQLIQNQTHPKPSSAKTLKSKPKLWKSPYRPKPYSSNTQIFAKPTYSKTQFRQNPTYPKPNSAKTKAI